MTIEEWANSKIGTEILIPREGRRATIVGWEVGKRGRGAWFKTNFRDVSVYRILPVELRSKK